MSRGFLPATNETDTTPHTVPQQPQPRDAQAIQDLLASMGLQPGSYQPEVVAMLLEFQNRYAREILTDAQEYCQHRESGGVKGHIKVDDLDLAISTRLSESFVSPPPREFLGELARQRNSQPLPLVPTREGVHLPSDRFALMQPNYKVKSNARRDEQKSHS